MLCKAGTILYLADSVHITTPEMQYDTYLNTLHKKGLKMWRCYHVFKVNKIKTQFVN